MGIFFMQKTLKMEPEKWVKILQVIYEEMATYVKSENQKKEKEVGLLVVQKIIINFKLGKESMRKGK